MIFLNNTLNMDVKVQFLSILALIFSFNAIAEKNPVVAQVNGRKIYLNELEQNYIGARYVVSNKKVTKEYVLNELINRELGIIKAQKSGLASDPKVESKINDILYHAQISRDLEEKLSEINITETDLKQYFKQNPEYRTSHILLRIKVNPDGEELVAAADVAKDIYSKIKRDPTKFEALANKHSQSPNAEIGGDVGFQPGAGLAPEYYSAIKGKSVGYVSPPIYTQYGLHIIKVTDIKKFKDINKTAYRKLIHDKKRDELLMKYFTNLRKNASIKIEKKYLK
jgi:parvulin-like peptidyl-prolyl isomerase